jgi:hypothetical protein
MIARCGAQRAHHWAHLGKRVCDHWWEPETQWHRSWKLNFPDAWQEIVLHDATGEKHIADIRTPNGVVIEFQHSHLPAEERAARERFYRDMVWVVDGLRLRRDFPRSQKGMRDLRPIGKGIFTHHFAEDLCPSDWRRATAPVFLDFGVQSASPDETHAPLWCLLPQPVIHTTIVKINRETFIRAANERPEQLLFRKLRTQLAEAVVIERRRQEQEKLRYVAEMMLARRQPKWRHGPRWPQQ